jgi:hypothetical protein
MKSPQSTIAIAAEKALQRTMLRLVTSRATLGVDESNSNRTAQCKNTQLFRPFIQVARALRLRGTISAPAAAQRNGHGAGT